MMCKAHLAALTWLLYAQLSYSKSHFADGTPGCKVPGNVVYVLRLSDAPANLKLSATVAAGLVNRHVQAPAVFNILLPTDEAWLLSAQTEECTLQNCTWAEITVPELWQLAYSSEASQGTILYDPEETWSLATVVTLCGVYQAIPVAAGRCHPFRQVHQAKQLKGFIAPLLKLPFQFLSKCFTPLYEGTYAYKHQNQVLDTRGMWKDSFQATSWAYKHVLPNCKHIHEMVAIQTPDLMQQGLLADYIVAQQLFAFWLPDLCQPGSPAQKLFWKITEIAWRQQSLLSVMGYYAHQEEIAACSQHHTEVSLVTDWSPNLSFWSMMPAVTQLTQAAPLPHELQQHARDDGRAAYPVQHQ